MGGTECIGHQSQVKDFFLGGYFGNRHHRGSPSGGASSHGRCECSSAGSSKIIYPLHATVSDKEIQHFFHFVFVLVCLKVFHEHLVLCLDDDDNFEESLSGESALCLSVSHLGD